jgi:hypothetical protein
VIAHGAVDEFGGGAEPVGDRMHRRAIDTGYSTIESHAYSDA